MSDHSAGAERHDPYAALRIANYRHFAAGFVLSSTGLQLLSITIGWEIWNLTHDPLKLGLVGLFRALPVVFLSMPAGHAADVFSRKWVLCCTQLAFAVLTLVLALVSRAGMNVEHLWVYYLLLTLMGCARSFNGPSRQSLLPLIVPRETFQNAVMWNSGVFQFSAIIGPLAAGFMLDRWKMAWPLYLITAAATAANALSVAFVKPREQQRPTGKFTISSMLAGMSHVWRERTIFGALALDLIAVLLGGATALMPVYAKEIITTGLTVGKWSLSPEVVLGLLKASPFVGALLMSLILAHRPPFKHAGPALLWSVIGFGFCTILFGFSINLWLSLVLLFLLGALDNVSVVIRHVLVQYHTPDELRGRVGAVNSVFIECSNELGAFESGLVAKLTTAVFSVVSGGIGTILAVAGLTAAVPELRRLKSLHEKTSDHVAK